MHRLGVLRRAASAVIVGYARYMPIERGKWRVITAADPFLVVKVVRGVYVRAGASWNSVAMRMVRAGVHEQETMQLFRDLLAPGMNVIDAGANIGEYALVAAREVGPSGSVHAFEPSPTIADCLRENAAMNGFCNIRVNANALSAHTETVFLRIHSDEPDTNYIVLEDPAGNGVRVAAITLDDYVERAALPSVDLIKMDVEGAEVLALTGAGSILSGAAPPVLIVELNPKCLRRAGASGEELLSLLRGYGYSCYLIESYGTDEVYYNVLGAKECHFAKHEAIKRFKATLPIQSVPATSARI